ncbi:MAG: hypothetical protein CM1200mP21_09880 [Candidatus Poseidoniales archaeon]|nr:MAG: hypothetical protein CM1200mP21_09880 [Candidatus Poseidoniales archaeon]
MSRDVLTDLERGHEDCTLRFADGSAFKVSYLSHTMPLPVRQVQTKAGE